MGGHRYAVGPAQAPSLKQGPTQTPVKHDRDLPPFPWPPPTPSPAIISAAAKDRAQDAAFTLAQDGGTIPLVYGQQRIQGRLIAAIGHYDNDTSSIVTTYWYVLCEGPINAITKVFLGTVDVTSRVGYTVALHYGTATQATDGLLNESYTNVSRFPRTAYASVTVSALETDVDTNAMFEVEGLKVYDPRADSTIGGSGSQLASDPTTWTYSNNLALCLRDFLTDPVHGCGLGSASGLINDLNFSAAATDCYALGYALNIDLESDATASSWLDLVRLSGNAVVYVEQGQYCLFIDQPQSYVVADFTTEGPGANARDVQYTPLALNDQPTRVVLEFPNAAKRFQQDTVTADHPGIALNTTPVREARYKADGITGESQAWNVACYILNKATYPLRVDFLGSFISHRLKIGSLITLTTDEGLVAQEFLVEALEEQEGVGETKVTARIYFDSIYSAVTITGDTPPSTSLSPGLSVTPGLIYAGPASGPSGPPAWRALTQADLPPGIVTNIDYPTGDIDGVNDTFVMAQTPVTGRLLLISDSEPVVDGVDYDWSGDTIVFKAAANKPRRSLVALYVYIGSGVGGAISLTPGPAGPSGYTGPQGVLGPAGATGAAGPSGIPGPQGTAGAAGASGPSGPVGVTGSQGAQGPTGPSGAAGPSGIPGVQGPQGPTGPAGPSGPSGVVGGVGPAGEQGPIGVTGAQGVAGPTGVTGPQGPLGSTGPSGPQGASGVSGVQGTQGISGPSGPQGSSGIQGVQGIQGITGVSGPQGPSGITGVTGDAGAAGPSGPSGGAGAAGPSGPSGGAGAAGPTGGVGATGPSGPHSTYSYSDPDPFYLNGQNGVTLGFSNLMGNKYLQVGLGAITPSSVSCSGNVTAYYSDERLKKNIAVIDNALAKLRSIRGVTFNANDLAASFGYTNTEREVGVLAREIQQVLPEAVAPAPFDTDKDGFSKSGENYLTVRYEKLVPLLIEAIKELALKVEAK